MTKATIETLLSNLYSGLISGGIFLATYLVLNMGLPLSLGFAAAGYVAGALLVFPSKEKKKAVELQELLRSVLTEGEGKITHMKELSYKIKNQKMKLHINEMCQLGNEIFATLQKKPQHVRSVEQFSSYYLDTTIKIINKHIELSKHKAYSEDIQHTLGKVENTLYNTKQGFQKQLEQLLKDDMMNLDAEMSVLEETLALEGVDIEEDEE